MKALYELKEMLCKELEEIAEKGELTAGSLETAHKLTDTIKNIGKIMMIEEEGGYSERGGMYSERRDSRGRYSREGGGYSEAGDWEARGRFDGGHSYDEGGSSYANRGKHYVRGHYSREGGGYSREDGRKEMIGELEDMMQKATGKDRDIVQRAMDEMRRA